MLHVASKTGDPIDSQHVISCLELLVKRHSALRSVFDADTFQIKAVEHLQLCAVKTLPSIESEEKDLKPYVQQEISEEIDLSKQIFRMKLFCSPKLNKISVCMTFHHIAMDGTSLVVLANELLLAFSGNELPPEPLQSTHLALTEAEQVAKPQDDAKSLKIQKWKDLFDGATSCMSFQTEPCSANAIPSFHSSHDNFLAVPKDISEALDHLSRAHKVSPVVVLAAMFATALHQYSGRQDVIFGTGSANRKGTTSNVVGYLVKILPIRVNFSIISGIASLLKLVRKNWSMILGGGIDLSDLVPHVSCFTHKASVSHLSPLQVLFSFIDAKTGELQDNLQINGVGATCRMESPKPVHTHVDLWFEVNPNVTNKNGEVLFLWEARRCVLSTFDVTRIHNIMCQCIKSAACGHSLCMPFTPEPTVTRKEATSGEHSSESTLVPLTALESPESCSVAVGPAFELNLAAGFIQQFEKKASSISNSPAFRFQGNVITYGEAVLLMKKLAAVLVERGVLPGDHVALYLSRTPWVYLAILAVLKCGAAYVPIALQNSMERVRKILFLSEAKLLVSEQELVSSNVPDCPVPCVCVDDTNTTLKMLVLDPNIVPDLPFVPQQSFYIVFTSGTTGTPKGVVITHSNMNATLHNFQHLFSPVDTEVTFASANISFDGHVLDSLGPLLNGACLVVAGDITEIGLQTNNDVTYAFATPSAASIVDWPASMRAVSVGGEVFSKACYENTRCIEKVVNMYGPTEATVFATATLVERDCDLKAVGAEDAIANIGFAVPGVELIVLNDDKKPVRKHEPGILYIGGPTVSGVGYFRNTEKTSECFVPNPLDPSATVYCTGDYVRMQSNESLQFIGRQDDQVKLRGMRFQLSEVEKVISLHPHVCSVVALVKNKGTSAAQLIAFVTPESVLKDEVLQHASKSLPSYMVPSFVIPMEQFPLTKEGKVDKRALCNISLCLGNTSEVIVQTQDSSDVCSTREQRQQVKQLAEPTNIKPGVTSPECSEIASKLAGVFGQTLNIDRYPVDADFFMSGGHSLLSFQLVKHLNQQLHLGINLSHVLQNSTPLALAQCVMNEQVLKEHQLTIGTSTLSQSSEKSIASSQGSVLHSSEPSHSMLSQDSCGESVSQQQKDFNYLDPVPSIPLSHELLQRLLDCFQKDRSSIEMSSIRNLSEELSKETGFSIPLESVLQYESIQALQSSLKLKTVLAFVSKPHKTTIVLHPQTKNDELPVFYVHGGIIGWALPYLKIAQSLQRYGVAVQRSQSAPTTTFEEMAAFYVNEIQLVQARGPYTLVGVCYGALLVYEIVYQLLSAGENVNLAVLINNSPVIEKRPDLFNSVGQPLANTMLHPMQFYQSVLKLSFPELFVSCNTESVNLVSLVEKILTQYSWLPFTATELTSAYLSFYNSLKPVWHGYKPQALPESSMIHNVVLIRNTEHPFFSSHDYGLLQLVDPSKLSVLVPPHELGLLSEATTMRFVSSVIEQYCK